MKRTSRKGWLWRMNRRKIKIAAFLVGLTLLIFILQYDFRNDNSIKPWNLPLSGQIILLDPGHGGPDGGAGDSEALEKDIALTIAFQLRDYLQQQGALVMMTREEDIDLADEETKGLSRRKTEDLKRRLELINESEADFYVSIHLNAIPSPRWSGAQTFYASQISENARAAKFIQDELRHNLENTTRKAKPINQVYILKYAKKPGVLVEVGFLSNPAERERLMQEDYQEQIAASIYKGILRYYSKEDELEESE